MQVMTLGEFADQSYQFALVFVRSGVVFRDSAPATHRSPPFVRHATKLHVEQLCQMVEIGNRALGKRALDIDA
jgi:hypothetical protein